MLLRCRHHTLTFPRRPLVMGIVNRPNVVRMPLVTAASTQPAITIMRSGTAAERTGEAAATVMVRKRYTRAAQARNGLL